MSSFLAGVERLLERALEAPTRLLFRTRLQPVELARTLGRAMGAESQVGPNGLQVPNRYRIALHPEDYRAFAAWRGALEHELAAYVEQRAQARGWHCPGRPVVEIHEDEMAPRGRPQVETATADPDPEVAAAAAPVGSREPERTAIMQRPAAPAAPPAPVGRLELPDGGTVALAQTVVRVGRAADNDIVIEHESVSRHHAEIRRDGGQYVVVDLGSTNGTRVDGQMVERHALRSGVVLHLGAVPLRFRVGD